MEIAPWKPFRELSAFRREMDELWNRFFGDTPFRQAFSREWTPSVDISETKDNILVKAELPGDYVGRALRGTIRVVGGENGYVDPDRGESATIIVTPRLTGYISLTVYTLRGEIVFADRVYVEQDIENTFEWGCKNDGGKLVSPGVYVFRFEGAGINETKKIAVVR